MWLRMGVNPDGWMLVNTLLPRGVSSSTWSLGLLSAVNAWAIGIGSNSSGAGRFLPMAGTGGTNSRLTEVVKPRFSGVRVLNSACERRSGVLGRGRADGPERQRAEDP